MMFFRIYSKNMQKSHNEALISRSLISFLINSLQNISFLITFRKENKCSFHSYANWETFIFVSYKVNSVLCSRINKFHSETIYYNVLQVILSIIQTMNIEICYICAQVNRSLIICLLICFQLSFSLITFIKEDQYYFYSCRY